MRVLVVEDEDRLSSYLEQELRREGFQTCSCASLEEVEALLATGYFAPDIAVLDRLLHGQDSLKLLQPLRAHFPRLRVLILSAIHTAEEKALALDAGADDYMSKPFSSRELMARIRALMRRPAVLEESSHLALSDVILEVRSRSLLVKGHKVNLTNKEFLLMQMFMREPGRVFSKAEIFELVWEMNRDSSSNVVEVTINNLRRKLEEAECELKILSRRNVGYWIEE